MQCDEYLPLSKGQDIFGKFTIKTTKVRKDGQLVLRGVEIRRDEVNIYKVVYMLSVLGKCKIGRSTMESTILCFTS